MTHAVPATIDQSSPEPVLVAAAVQATLVAAAALGWSYLDDARIAAIVTAVATIGTVVAAMVARGRVRAIRPADPALSAPSDLAAELRDIVRAELTAILRDGPVTTLTPRAHNPAATSPWFTAERSGDGGT